MSDLPNVEVEVGGKRWNIEARVIVALMRKLNVTHIELSDLDLATPAKGLSIRPEGVTLTEHKDGWGYDDHMRWMGASDGRGAYVLD